MINGYSVNEIQVNGATPLVVSATAVAGSSVNYIVFIKVTWAITVGTSATYLKRLTKLAYSVAANSSVVAIKQVQRPVLAISSSAASLAKRTVGLIKTVASSNSLAVVRFISLTILKTVTGVAITYRFIPRLFIASSNNAAYAVKQIKKPILAISTSLVSSIKVGFISGVRELSLFLIALIANNPTHVPSENNRTIVVQPDDSEIV